MDSPGTGLKSSRDVSIFLNENQRTGDAGCWEFGEFRLDPASRILFHGSDRVALPPKAFDLLATLARRGGRVVSKPELMDALWPNTFVEDANLTQHVFLVRKALERDSRRRRYLVTVPGQGYRFVQPVKGLEAAAPASAAEGERAVRTVAVLPLKLLGSAREDGPLAIGVSESLVVRLGGIGQITVFPAASLARFGGLNADPLGAGRELNADAVLGGSIQTGDGRVRITVQLILVSTGQLLWAGQFDESLTGIFAIQDSISERVAEALRVRLNKHPGRLSPPPTRSPEAYQQYCKGRFFWAKRTGDGFRKAIGHFEEAIAHDRRYAPAYTGLADCYSLLSYYGLMRPHDAYAKARTAALTALHISDTLAEAHASLAMVNAHYDWDWAAAEDGFRRAIELNPGYAAARDWYAEYLSAMGRHEEAIAEIERARELDPFSLIINRDVGYIYHLARRCDRAVEELLATLDLDPGFAPGHWYLGRVYEQKAAYKEAIEEFKTARALSPGLRMLGEIGHAYGRAGERDAALKIRDDLSAAAAQGYVPPYELALVHLGLGQREEAMRHLESACNEHNWDVVNLRVEPRLDILRDHPGFTRLLRQVGLG